MLPSYLPVAASQISPEMLSAIGISVVFVALAMLVFILMGFSRVLADTPASAPAKPAAPMQDEAPQAPAAAEDEEALLRHVALAAWALHQRRRISVRRAAPSSAWTHAARAHATHRDPRNP